MHEFIQQDQTLFLYLNNLGNGTYDQFWILVSEIYIWVPLYIIFLYLLYKNYKPKSLLFILLFIALGITFSDQLANVFKIGVGRLRPCHDPKIKDLMRVVKCGGPYGFYSGHAANTFFLATFLTRLLKKQYLYLPFFLFFWAATVSYSRIYLGVHFPGDIVMGAVVGILSGGLFSTLAMRVVHRHYKADLA